MILIETGYAENFFRIDTIEMLNGMTDSHFLDIFKELKKGYRFEFIIPPSIESNMDKTTYKVGFLYYYLKRLYPEKKHDFIYKMINNEYQVFLENRQILRHIKKFDEKYLK